MASEPNDPPPQGPDTLRHVTMIACRKIGSTAQLYNIMKHILKQGEYLFSLIVTDYISVSTASLSHANTKKPLALRT